MPPDIIVAAHARPALTSSGHAAKLRLAQPNAPPTYESENTTSGGNIAVSATLIAMSLLISSAPQSKRHAIHPPLCHKQCLLDGRRCFCRLEHAHRCTAS